MDAVVLGGSVDGLAAGLALARSGRKVALVAPEASLGGIAAREVFAEGISVPGTWTDTSRVQRWASDRLGLDLPWRPRRPVAAVGDGDTALVLHGDATRDASALHGAAPGDQEGYTSILAWLDRVRPLVTSMMGAPPPALASDAPLWPLAKAALDLRRLGPADMHELLRMAVMPVGDWLAEHVSSPLLTAFLAMPALIGTRMGPRSPQSAGHLLVEECLRSREEVRGGAAAVVDALVAACSAAGVEVHLGSPVGRIEVEDGAVVGVSLPSGSMAAPMVISALGPRTTLLGLLDPGVLPPSLFDAARRIRARGSVAVLRVALEGDAVVRGDPSIDRARVASHPDELERGWDAVKHGRLPDRVPAELHLPARSTERGRDVTVVTALTHAAPTTLVGGWTPGARAALTERLLATLERAIPDGSARVVGHELLTPSDLAERHALDGGHPCQAERALDQLWALRPAPALARYRVPGVGGLFLGGAGSHPGGVLTLAPGVLAADAATSTDR